MKNLNLFFTLLLFLLPSQYALAQEKTDSTEIISRIAAFELPKVSPYYFQHQYLSVIAPMITEDNSIVFNNPTNLNSYTPVGNGFRSPFSDSDIVVEAFEDEGKKIFVWKFPEPEYLREALYMAFIPVNGRYVAYAICIGQLVDWEISTSSEQMRKTFGRVKRPESAEECLDILKKRGAYAGVISPGEFFQSDYKSPEYRPQQ